MSLFMSQKIVNMTFFSNRCAQNFFFISRFKVSILWTVFLTLSSNDKPVFGHFVKIVLLRVASTYTVHILP